MQIRLMSSRWLLVVLHVACTGGMPHACIHLHCYPVDSCHCQRCLLPTRSGFRYLLLHAQKFCPQWGHLCHAVQAARDKNCPDAH